MDFDNQFFSQKGSMSWNQSNEAALKSKLAKQKA